MENWRKLFKHTPAVSNVQLVSKAALETETREYKVTGEKDQLDEVEKMFWFMQHLGQIGASRTFEVSVDGDGAARLEFERIDKNHDLIELKNMDNDLEKIHIGIE